MGKPPTLVPLSEEEQKLVSEVLKRICIRMKLYIGVRIRIKQSWSGPR